MEIIQVLKKPKLCVLKSRKALENVNNNLQQTQVDSVKKCLFGMPSAEDVDKLLKEQIKEDWNRIKNRFGINIDDIENMENQKLDAHTPKKRKLESPKTKRINNSRKRRLTFQQPYNTDRKITDFFKMQKVGHPEKKEQ